MMFLFLSCSAPGDQVCQGIGASKKAAKDEAARRMLARLESVDQPGKSSEAASGSVAEVRPDDIPPVPGEERSTERVVKRFSSDGIHSGQLRSSPAIIPPTSETLEESRERREAAPVESGGEKTDRDLEQLVDQFKEFTEFLKWKKLVKQENDLKAEDEDQSLVKKSAEMLTEGRNPPSQQLNDLERREKSSENPVQSSVLSPEAAPFQPQRERVPSYSLHPVSGRDSLTSLIAESNSQERFILILENISLI